MALVTLYCRDKEDKLVDTLNGSFDSKELQVLLKFKLQMERVRNTSLLSKGLPAITKIRFDKGELEFVCKPYTDTELHELLHVLRPVTLERENASFVKVCALIKRQFASRTLSDHFKAIRQIFDKSEFAAYMQMSIDGRPLFDQSTLDDWLNGVEYHTDADKAEAWRKVEKALNSGNARALVMNQLHARVKALFMLEHIVDLVLERANDAHSNTKTVLTLR